ncbi:TusE/DsrC/DsvC family sulfur relay protein [Marinagarivorans cellulosilyticus]|uniref:Sulfurtransferase n=1 Tax=Marinagarivorans cellulosilyticus TaxID=2721545 RepID=A0AAN1WHD2_9GAMM|nr:TusE/DsrC/DsvC family sulfur relay protein [Marinagarivorans cellulosilyticus]BCD97629.1 tRNA 2-thiouridine synthesizing protein E [Marinagarivorans cellulosilyticus]
MKLPALDAEGFLINLSDWSEPVANALAKNEGIELTNAHWEIIHCLQQFYREFDLSPAMRPLIKYIGIQLGKEKANSIYLLQLFPGSPAKVAAKVAGLPKPENCL